MEYGASVPNRVRVQGSQLCRSQEQSVNKMARPVGTEGVYSDDRMRAQTPCVRADLCVTAALGIVTLELWMSCIRWVITAYFVPLFSSSPCCGTHGMVAGKYNLYPSDFLHTLWNLA